MSLKAKTIKLSLSIFKLFTLKMAPPLFLARTFQSISGRVLRLPYNKYVKRDYFKIAGINACAITPKNQTQDAVILYLHGGGYSYGSLSYATGFASELAYRTGAVVVPIEYRLAPENKFPSAIEDALLSYEYLLASGYQGEKIFIFGESAGGGLAYSLTFKIRECGLPMPAGIITLSPWADLTQSSISMQENKRRDPSLTKFGLDYFTKNLFGIKKLSLLEKSKVENPYASPVYGDFSNFPKTLIFVGGDEILLDDALTLAGRLGEAGVLVKTKITPKMWHCYLVYGLKEHRGDFDIINEFLAQKGVQEEGEKYEY